MKTFNIKITVLFLFIFFINAECLIAQENEDQIVLPQSPNTAKLGEFGFAPVGLFTGAIQYNIPLYEYKTRYISVPISLNYSSNGLRVDELPTSVGMSWSLNAGGAIVRVKKGLVDNLDNIDYEPIPLSGVGPDPSVYLLDMKAYLASTSTGAKDNQLDLFTYNFNGYSGKFYIWEGECVQLNPSPLSIVVITDPSNLNNGEFKITTFDGVEYYFGGNEDGEVSDCIEFVRSSRQSATDVYDSAWYLKTIKHASGDEVKFYYDKNAYNYFEGFTQIIQALYSKHWDAVEVFNPPVISEISRSSKAGQSVILSSIEYSNSDLDLDSDYRVEFTNSETFTSIPHFLWKLDEIKVFNSDNNKIKELQFNYDFIVGDALKANNNYSEETTETWHNSRMFLKRISELSEASTGNEIHELYDFEYYSPEMLAPLYSYSQDYMGYFNNVVGNEVLVYNFSDNSLLNLYFPDVYVQQFKAALGNLNPNDKYSHYGMLRKITFPTGGYNIINYEGNSIYGVVPTEGTKKHINLSIIHDPEGDLDDEFSKTTQIYTEVMPHSQIVPFYANVTTFSGQDCLPHSGDLFIEIENLTVETQNNIIGLTSGTGAFIENENSVVLSEFEGQKYYHFNFLEGSRYLIKITTVRPCTDGFLSFSYDDAPASVVFKNIKKPGNRVKSIEMYSNKSDIQIKYFHYGNLDLNSLNNSTGIEIKHVPNFSKYRTVTTDDGGYSGLRENLDLTYTINSGSMYNLYSFNGNSIVYESVIESFGRNFEGGGVWHKFNTLPENKPSASTGIPVGGASNSNVFGTGEKVQTKYFKVEDGEIKVVKKIENTYSNESGLQSTFIQACIATSASVYYNPFHYYDFSTYLLNRKWRYLSSTKETNYNDFGFVENEQLYSFSNSSHLQQTESSHINSKGETVSQKIYYPEDFGTPHPMLTQLISVNKKATPILTLNKVDDFIISAKYIEYGTFNGQLLPSKIFVYSQEDESLTEGDLFYFIYHNYSYAIWPYFQLIVEYLEYDETGNLLEVRIDESLTSSAIYGYNKQSAIAYASNSKIDELGYTSFESDDISDWGIGSLSSTTITESYSGVRAYLVGGGANSTTGPSQTFDIDQNEKYIFSFWVKAQGSYVNNSGKLSYKLKRSDGSDISGQWKTFNILANDKTWTYNEIIIDLEEISLSEAKKIEVFPYQSGTSQNNRGFFVDDLRFHPADANFQAVSLIPQIGVISSLDPTTTSINYEYDQLNRLFITRDHRENIRSKNDYNKTNESSYFELSSYLLNIDHRINSEKIGVISDCLNNWQIESISYGASWLSVAKNNANEFEILTTENTSSNSREAEVNVKTCYGYSVTIKVIQRGAIIYDFSVVDELELSENRGIINIDYVTNCIDTDWEINTILVDGVAISDPNNFWISVYKGNGVIGFQYEENQTIGDRYCTVPITDCNGNQHFISVTQRRYPLCYYNTIVDVPVQIDEFDETFSVTFDFPDCNSTEVSATGGNGVNDNPIINGNTITFTPVPNETDNVIILEAYIFDCCGKKYTINVNQDPPISHGQ